MFRKTLALYLFLASGLCALGVDFARLDSELRSVIENREAADAELLQAISRMGPVTEPADFWKRIANNSDFETPHRRRAIFALFRRHLRTSSSINHLAGMIAPAKWLDEKSDVKITKISMLTGQVPVDLNINESVFSIPVLGGPRIYLRVMGNMALEDFTRLLHNDRSTNVRDGIILQIGFGDDYEAWLSGKARR